MKFHYKCPIIWAKANNRSLKICNKMNEIRFVLCRVNKCKFCNGLLCYHLFV